MNLKNDIDTTQKTDGMRAPRKVECNSDDIKIIGSFRVHNYAMIEIEMMEPYPHLSTVLFEPLATAELLGDNQYTKDLVILRLKDMCRMVEVVRHDTERYKKVIALFQENEEREWQIYKSTEFKNGSEDASYFSQMGERIFTFCEECYRIVFNIERNKLNDHPGYIPLEILAQILK